MSALNIEEIKQLHRGLETDIFRLIANFEKTTGTCVIDIHVGRFIGGPVCGKDMSILSSLDVDVRL